MRFSSETSSNFAKQQSWAVSLRQPGSSASHPRPSAAALAGWGIQEERVKRYEAGIKGDGILMGVKTRSHGDAKKLGEEWKHLQGEDVYWQTVQGNSRPASKCF